MLHIVKFIQISSKNQAKKIVFLFLNNSTNINYMLILFNIGNIVLYSMSKYNFYV